MTWRMPHEGDPHERTWMAWPTGGYTLGDSSAAAEQARRAWADVAHAVLRFEPLTMVVDPSDADLVRNYLGSDPEYIVAPLDDAWMRDILGGAVDAQGRALEIVDLPAPEVLRDDEGWVDYSYVNHHLVNGGVIACTFDDPGDAVALDILRAQYPGREVVGVDARPLFARGGGIHCITQQQPAV
jgi:agmatine/peptidylarginine deiminase